MNDDTVKLIRIPADTWRAVVEALSGAAVALDDINGMDDVDDMCELAEQTGDSVRDALELARKVSAE